VCIVIAQSVLAGSHLSEISFEIKILFFMALQ